jgi:PrsW family intramembrane metalloprotease
LADFAIYVATWGQSVLLLGVLAYMCNHPKATALSLDAMIKYFFAGFFLSVSLAVFWELFLGLFVKAVMSIFLALAGVHIVEDTDGYQESSSSSTAATGAYRDYWGIGFGQGILSNPLSTASARHDDYLKAFGNEHPVFYTFYLLFASFFLAAFVEEACKYFGYRMIEHPDFLTKQELDESMHVVHGERDSTDQDTQGSDDDHLYYEEQGRASIQQRRQDKLQRRRQEQLKNDFSKHGQSMQAHGGAITLAMICVAMGFTCCENLVYIFIYSGSSFYMELFVLLCRAMFPVHPIASAIQSIGVVKRDLENSRNGSRLGRGILLPAALFHGSYDFFILWIDFLVKRKGNYTDDDEKIAMAEACSFITSLAIMAGAVIYYVILARQQRDRLHALDHQVCVSGHSRLK